MSEERVREAAETLAWELRAYKLDEREAMNVAIAVLAAADAVGSPSNEAGGA